MLGWEFFVMKQEDARSRQPDGPDVSLARWKAGLGGTQWLEKLVSEGVASDLGGSGYPNRYLVPAGALTILLERGLPKHDGPLVIGEGYVAPPGWTGMDRINMARLRELDPSEKLMVEAWDQS